jgi:Zn finger protein HypA/HybF involved in hydrogenase expression
MVPNNADIDPYSPELNYFECRDCGTRTTSENRLTTCGACGGQLENIAVPRE